MSDRTASERQGRRAEWLAAAFLQMKGYRVLARRFKAAGGEIDIAARRGSVLVFAEVKTRARLDDAIFAVTPAARRRIETAGRAFLASRPHLADLGVRYDIIAFGGAKVRHIRDAWRSER
ncbi:MAG: YraN family protein [Parvularculaceae bacterium]|nr:YraN family protein [Parvularculaceae bacterium]